MGRVRALEGPPPAPVAICGPSCGRIARAGKRLRVVTDANEGHLSPRGPTETRVRVTPFAAVPRLVFGRRPLRGVEQLLYVAPRVANELLALACHDDDQRLGVAGIGGWLAADLADWFLVGAHCCHGLETRGSALPIVSESGASGEPH